MKTTNTKSENMNDKQIVESNALTNTERLVQAVEAMQIIWYLDSNNGDYDIHGRFSGNPRNDVYDLLGYLGYSTEKMPTDEQLLQLVDIAENGAKAFLLVFDRAIKDELTEKGYNGVKLDIVTIYGLI